MSTVTDAAPGPEKLRWFAGKYRGSAPPIPSGAPERLPTWRDVGVGDALATDICDQLLITSGQVHAPHGVVTAGVEGAALKDYVLPIGSERRLIRTAIGRQRQSDEVAPNSVYEGDGRAIVSYAHSEDDLAAIGCQAGPCKSVLTNAN